MSTCPDRAAAAIDSARLLIHTGTAAETMHSRLVRVLRAMLLAYGTWQVGEPVRLVVADMRGNRLLSLEDALPLIDVPLPPGTYQVNACRGNVRRAYTFTLERNTCFDLYLSLADVSRTQA